MKEIIGDPLRLPDGTQMPLSRGVSAGGFVFVSGQLGIGSAGAIAPGGVRQQTRQVIENIAAVLATSGLTLDHVVKVTGWLVREDDFVPFNDVYSAFFSSVLLARSMVVSKLLVPGALVELEAIAICQPDRPSLSDERSEAEIHWESKGSGSSKT